MSAEFVVAESAPRRCYELTLTLAREGARLAHCRQISGQSSEQGAQTFERQLIVEDILHGQAAWGRSLWDALASLSGVAAFRREGTRRASIRGRALQSAAPHAMRGDRQYIIEVARLGAGGVNSYYHYQELFMTPVLSRYDYWPELELQATRSSGLGFRADLVKIGYFTGADACERLWRDRDWALFMNYLYRHAAPESVWMLARRPS